MQPIPKNTVELPMRTNEALENRKLLEKEVYEELYADTSLTSIESYEGRSGLTGHLLSASESFFINQLITFAKPDSAVLEIGCGGGTHSVLIAKRGAYVTGIDMAENAVRCSNALAEKSGCKQRTSFLQMDAEQLEFPDASFDLVVNHEIFSSIDIHKAVPEIVRVLRPSGTLLAIECLGHNPVFNLNRRIGQLRGRRTAWAVDHVLRMEDIEYLKSLFKRTEVNFFHLAAFLGVPLSLLPFNKERLFATLNRIDRKIMQQRFFQKLAFKTVITLHDPQK